MYKWLKNIILLVLVLILAIALTIGVYMLLRFEFKNFVWEYGFIEFVVSIIAFIFRVANPVNLFVYCLCGAAWKGVIYQLKEVLGDNPSNNHPSHATNKRRHGSSLGEFDDMHGSNEDKSYLYDELLSVIVLILAFGFISCKNGTQKIASQAVEEQTDSVISEYPIYDRLLKELDSTEIYNDSILCGYWFQPHAACVINIFLHKDNTYEFKYCKNGEGDEVIDILKKGRYTINGEAITLTSDEGWDDYFNGVIYYKSNGTNHYLTDKKDGFYLVKGSD